MSDKVMNLSTEQDGFLGIESVGDVSGKGITISYWKSMVCFVLNNVMSNFFHYLVFTALIIAVNHPVFASSSCNSVLSRQQNLKIDSLRGIDQKWSKFSKTQSKLEHLGILASLSAQLSNAVPTNHFTNKLVGVYGISFPTAVKALKRLVDLNVVALESLPKPKDGSRKQASLNTEAVNLMNEFLVSKGLTLDDLIGFIDFKSSLRKRGVYSDLNALLILKSVIKSKEIFTQSDVIFSLFDYGYSSGISNKVYKTFLLEGLVESQVVESDRRLRNIALTPKAIELIGQAEAYLNR